jgi:type II secretory pathway pseudopilin PulG
MEKRLFSSGFTMFELLIVMAFIAIIGSVGIGYYFNYQRQTILRTTADNIQSFLYITQQRSIGQEDASQWGVHFENPAGGNKPFYASFKGATYTAPVETRFLDAALDFAYPAEGESVDIVFSRINGKVADGVHKKVYVSLNPGAAVRGINISPFGVITLNDGEVGWWRMDEGSGTTTGDSSGYANGGDVTGNVAWVASGCKNNNSGCADFSSGGYVDLGTDTVLDIAGPMTLSAWVKLDSNTATYTVGGRAGTSTSQTTYWMDIRGGNTQIYFGGYTSVGGGAYVAGNYNFAIGTWYHVVGVDNGTNLKIYVDAEEVASGGRADRITGDWPAAIGKRGQVSSSFDGQIDDFRLYDRGFSSDEVKHLYEITK